MTLDFVGPDSTSIPTSSQKLSKFPTSKTPMDKLDIGELYKQSPPAFGHAMHQHFALDPEYINLNHGDRICLLFSDSPFTIGICTGSYGSPPLPVLAAVNKMSIEIEANPDKFHRITYMPLLVEVRRKLAQLIGANLDECVLVTNASVGVNTILRNFEWEKGDIIVPCRCLHKSTPTMLIDAVKSQHLISRSRSNCEVYL
jgi:hypothetical protein